MRKLKLCFVVVSLFFLTGCWDRQDPEDSEYIITLGVDLGAEGYDFTMAPAKTQEKEPKLVEAVSCSTLADAIADANGKNSRRTDLGQLKMVIFGKSLLENEAKLLALLDELGRNQDISGKVMVLGSGDSAKACLGALMKEDNGTGLFLWDFYKNTAQEVATTKGLDLETFYIELTEQRGSAILPCITPEGEGLRLGGGVVLRENRFHFLLDEKTERGYLFLLGEAEGAVLEAVDGGQVVPLRVVKSDVSYDFMREPGGKVRCIIELKVKGDLLGKGEDAVFHMSESKKMEKIFSELIKNEIENTIKVAKEQDAPEIYGIPLRLRRAIPGVQGAFTEDTVTIEIQAKIKIRDTGRIR